MSLKNRISEDVKQAMRAGDKLRLTTLRMVTAAIKQRRESATQYRAGQRPELAEAEEAEIDLLAAYLPEPLSDAALDEIIDQAVAEVGAADMAAMGSVMGLIKARVQGRADMREVSARVRSRLSA